MSMDFTTSEYVVACVKKRVIDRLIKAKKEAAEFREKMGYPDDELKAVINTLNGVLYDFTVAECNLVLDDETEVPEE